MALLGVTPVVTPFPEIQPFPLTLTLTGSELEAPLAALAMPFVHRPQSS